MRNRWDGGDKQKPADDTAGSVHLTLHFSSQEELLALLMADPTSMTSTDTETDTVAPGTGQRSGAKTQDPEMLRTQSIAELKQRLSDISIESDDELFKAAPLK